MKFSRLFSRTLRDDQKEADEEGHNLLLRAGYVRQLASGLYTYMHLGLKSKRKIVQIIREEMDGIGGDEICMPLVHPAEIWKKTGRWSDIDASLVRFKDRNDRDMVLAMTHEEVVATLAATEIETYRQLPRLVYQIYSKFRDEPRPRGGLIRVREFTMKDSYSLDKDAAGMKKQYNTHFEAYHRIFARIGLPVTDVLSDSGMMGGGSAHEFMYMNPIGEDTVFFCKQCDYRANKEVATIQKSFSKEAPQPLKEVLTPGKTSISALSEFLQVPASRTAKVVFYHGIIEGKDKLILAVVRGDHEAHPLKIQNCSKAKRMRPATAEEIASAGCVPGYASPIGIDRKNAVVLVDDYIVHTNNLVAGANKDQYHYLHACYGRDFQADITGDLMAAYEGALCPRKCGHTLHTKRGIEVGNIFQLGTKYSDDLQAAFMDQNGKSQPVYMGSYGIGIGRVLACMAEEYRDEFGLKWPISIAPYEIHLISLPNGNTVKDAAGEVYETLKKAGIEVIYDDRSKKEASPGVKFGDADLMGIPIRITVGNRSLKQGGAELKLRSQNEKFIIPLGEITGKVKYILSEMQKE